MLTERLRGAGLLLGLLFLLGNNARPALAQRDAPVPDPDPEIERSSFEVADGYEVNLFAGDPLLAKPIQMNFDSRGRLWVASSEVYPQIEPGQVANDKILILEDKDGDGEADSTTVFADGLLIPTAVAPGDGGAYVANSTEMLFLKDTDGDGKADERQVMLSGFGTEDTHHIIHTFRWGPDGRLYFNQSTYIHSTVETPWGPRYLGGGGIWQFRPSSRRLEVFSRGLINPWGHAIDAFGQSFATDGAGGEGINWMIPGASYAWTPGEKRIVAGLNPGSPKHCGLEILSGRHLPEEMQGVLVTHDFRAHRVCRFELSDDGAGYASRELPELIKTRHPAFRPVDVVMGPDGAIYVADWYNPIIQHGEVDFRDPRRDHTHGRIWRITAKGRPLVNRPRLAEMNVEQLLDSLKAPEGWTRQFAGQRLKEMGPGAVLPALGAWVAGLDATDANIERHRLEALWLHQALDVPAPELLQRLLGSSDFRVRAAAVRVVPDWAERTTAIDWIAALDRRVNDEHARVRLEAVRALASFKNVRAFETALGALVHPLDRFLDHALWLTCRDLQDAWLPALQAGTLPAIPEPGALAFALGAAGSPEVVGPLLDALESGRIDGNERRVEVLRIIAGLADAEQLGRSLRWSLTAVEPDARVATLDALIAGGGARGVVPSGELEALLTAASSGDPAMREAVLRVARAWPLESMRGLLKVRAAGGSTPEAERLLAIEGIGRLGGEDAVGALSDLLGGRDVTHSARTTAVVNLAALDPSRAAAPAVELLADADHGKDAALVFGAFLGRKGGSEALAGALESRSLPADVAKAGVRLARSAGQPSPALVEAIRRAGGLAESGAVTTPEQVAAVVARVSQMGDPRQGERLFRRAELQCLKCHAVAGAGGQVGPGLESIGASAPVDYLVESLLEPGKAVKEGYHSIVVGTREGQVVTGIVRRRDAREIVLRDAEGRDVVIAADQVEEEAGGPSLMPRGMVDELTQDEVAHLVRFLSELGKAGPYAVTPAQVVRRWETLPATMETAAAVKRVGYDAAARGVQPTDAPPIVWQPAYSQVDGRLPLADVPSLPNLDASPARHWVRFAVEMTQPGPVGLKLNANEGVTAWVDGQRIEVDQLTSLDLKSGTHLITLAIDPGVRRTPELACDLVELPDSSARVRLVTGQ